MTVNPPARSFVAYLTLVVEAEQARLLLVPDAEQRKTAMVRGYGHALAHLDRNLPVSCRQLLESVRETMSEVPEHALPTPEAIDRLVEIVGRAGGALELRHAWPVGFKLDLPFHLVTEARRTWPTSVDMELLGLEMGRRVLVKREYLDDRAAERWEDAWAAAGASAQRMPIEGHPGYWTLFGARQTEMLQEAVAREQVLGRGRTPDAESATRWFGEALGYPECCVRAYLEDGRRDDLYTLARCIPSAPATAVPPVSLTLNALLNLISYIPCRPNCEATRDLGTALHAGISARDPGFAGRWDPLAQRVHVVDSHAVRWALQTTDDAEGMTITDAVRLELGPEGGVEVRPAPDAAGHRLVSWMGGVRGDDGFWGVFLSDHRAGR